MHTRDRSHRVSHRSFQFALAFILFASTLSYATQSFPCGLVALDRTITICTPIGTTALESPIRIVAGTRHSQPVKLIQIYIDGKKSFETAGDQADTNFSLSAGPHNITVRALDAVGFYSKSMQVSIASALLPKFAYAPATDGTISAFTVHPVSGQLRPNGYVLGDNSASDATVSWGRLLFVANGTAGTISAFRVATDGTLAEVAGSPYRCGIDCRSLAIDPTGTYLYSTDYAADLVRSFIFHDKLNYLETYMSAAAGSQPRSMVVDPGGRFAYVINSGDSTVSAFSIIQGMGALTPITGSPFKTGANATAITMDRSARYVAVTTPSAIYVYFVASNGSLRTATGSPLALTNSGSATLYPTGSFLYVLRSDRVAAYKVQFSSGALTLIGTYATGSLPKSLTVDAQGKFLYVANSGSPSDVWTFRIDQNTGALALAYKNRTHGPTTSLALTKATTAPTYTPNFLYVGSTNGDATGGIVAGFSIGTGGALTRLPSSPFAHPRGAVALATHPSGRYIYAPGRQPTYFEGEITQYIVNSSTGALTVGQDELWYEPLDTHSMAVDPSGRFAYSPSGGNNEPVLYGWQLVPGTGAIGNWLFYGVGGPRYESVSIDPTGKFVYFMGGDGPQVSVIDPRFGDFGYMASGLGIRQLVSTAVDGSGQFVIGIDDTNNAVVSYRIQGISGLLSMTSLATTGSKPSAVAVDPYSRFVYVTNSASNDVSAFRLNGSTGGLTPVAGNPFPAGVNPIGLTLDNSGRYVYVLNSLSSDVSAFSINGTTGALTPIGSRVPTGANGPVTSIVSIGTVR